MGSRWTAPGSLWVALLAACSHDASVLYEEGERPNYLSSPECLACLEVECPGVIDDCEAEPECGDGLACLAECTDPLCRERCARDHAYRGADQVRAIMSLWTREEVVSAPWAPLGRCAAGACKADCAIGQRYACIGDWEVDSSYAPGEQLALHLGVTTYPTWDSIGPAVVRACRRADLECSAPLAEAETADDMVSLEVPVGQGEATGFQGYLEVAPLSEDSGLRPWRLYRSAGWQQDDAWLAGLVSQANHEVFHEINDVSYEGNVSSINVWAFDCGNNLPEGLTLEISGSCGAWPDCVQYWDVETLSRDLPASVSGGLGTAVVFAEAGNQTVTLRTPDGRVHSSIEIPVREGVDYHVQMHPLTRAQQAALSTDD